MCKLRAGIVFALLGCLLFPMMAISKTNVTYNPNDVSKYNGTGLCPKCDLSSATLFCRDHSLLDGAIINHAWFADVHQCNDSSLKNSFLIGVRFGNSSFASSDFSGAKMREANLSGINLTSAIFTDVDLSDANLSYSTLVRTNFLDATLTGADLAHADLTLSNITGTQLSSARTYCDATMPDGSKGPPC